ncbi:reverse transcriptase domain-containing protein [Tanacetum coccineum]|uniref:Reverse transcriptase domain-containing protein n=1 Tax=Tanacetum coccineum TaxID=301880 RepID=A0ABQ4YM69_9ASTR
MSLHGQRRNCAWTQDFSKIARPITKLLEKDTPFEFDDECQKAFELLKEKLTCAPVIVSPNWNLPFELMCDASDFAIGVVLVLRHLFKKQDAKPRLIRWILLLQELDIVIKDRKGTENVAADHLSRIENDESNNDSEVDDNFPGEILMEINTKNEPWFADFANYLEEPYLFIVCSDETILPFQNAQSSNHRQRNSLLQQNNGKNYHLPFEIEHRAYWALKNCNPDLIAAGEKRMFQLHELDELKHQAYENTRLYKVRTKV